MGICSGISTMWLFIHCFKIELEFGSVFVVAIQLTMTMMYLFFKQ